MINVESLQEERPDPGAMIEQMLVILDAERAALGEHRLEDLDHLQAEKAEAVRQLSRLNPALLPTELHQALGACERKNLENGALIQLLHGHVAGSLAVLTGAGTQPQSYDHRGRQLQHQPLSGGFTTSA